MRTQRKGASLFEIIVVMAILVIAAGLAVPSLKSMMGNTPMKAAADQVKSRWAEARAKAIEEGKPYRFQIKDSTSYRIAPDDDFDSSSGLDDTLPKDVTFGSTSNTGNNTGNSNGNNTSSTNADGNVSIIFLPDGTTTSDVELGLKGQGYAPVTLKLNKTTGASR